MNYTFLSTKIVANATIDHENMGVDTIFVILSCIVLEILTKKKIWAMASLIGHH